MSCPFATLPRHLRVASFCALMAWLPAAALADTSFEYDRPSISPESGSGFEDKPGWSTESFAVAAANPLATDAGYQVLKAGGSALDAAIAVQMVLTLVEPQSSGIGGGSFLMHFDGETVQAYDGRETAPAAVDENLFLDGEGKPLDFMEAVTSGRSVGVPGTLRMLEMAHEAHGRLPWAALFEPAIALADGGFPVSARLHQSLADTPDLLEDARAASFFFTDEGEPLPVGHTLKNPALAVILQRIAEQGSTALHTGPVAENIVARVQGHPAMPGRLSREDLATYTAMERDPLCTDWLAYRVCGFPPPSSGHLTVMQILGMLEQLPPLEAPPADKRPSVDWLHRFLEASRLAFADRNRYIADPAFVEAPGGDWTTLLDPDYLEARAKLIEADTSLGSDGAKPGNPGSLSTTWAVQPTQPEHGTSHVSIVDAHGNALALTSSIEQAFGARMLADGGTGMPGGFLLNNELTDFSFLPRDEGGTPIANRVEPEKRPRSSMSPTLVFDRGGERLVASLGSAGGAAIIHYTARTLAAMLDWGLDAQQAIDLPHAITLGGTVYLEEGHFSEATRQALAERGHEIDPRELTSGLQAIRRTEAGFFGGADPRREGVVMGD